MKSPVVLHSWLMMLWIAAMILTPLSQAEDKALFAELDHLQTLLNIPHQKNPESMIQASQVWRRKPGVERWEMPSINVSTEIKHKVIKILTRMGVVNELTPNQKQFDYILLLGATVPRMQRRINQVIRLWEQGIRGRHVVFLVGQRPLTPSVDQPEQVMKKAAGPNPPESARPLTEAEAARMLWLFADLPNDMKAINCDFIDTPRKWIGRQWERPNTRDTLQQWLRTNPVSGSVLIISDQPHAAYQETVVRQELPASFTTSLAAKAADPNMSLANYLDALALWLHNMPATEKYQPSPPAQQPKESLPTRPPAG